MEFDDLKELVEAFVVETDEIIVEFEQQLITLEQEVGTGTVPLGRLEDNLRALHTFKGNAGMLGMHTVSSLVHNIEEIIKQDISADSDLIRALFAVLDDLKLGLTEISRGASDAEHLADWSAFLATVIEDAGGAQTEPEKIEKKADSSKPSLGAFGFADDFDEIDDSVGPTDASLQKQNADFGAKPDPATLSQDTTLRVSSDKLDQLQREVGELILAFNATTDFVLGQVTKTANKAEMRDMHDHIDRLSNRVRRVQGQTTKIRLLGLSSILRRVPRIVRDAANKAGKKVQVVVDGENTEADKSVVDQLSEVIVHLVRNAVDHGIESEEDRRVLGKNDAGLVIVRASGKGDHIQIEVEDDGGGVDLKVVREKAVLRGIVGEDEAKSTDRETALRWLFESGFSTKDTATELSGRGVGLDVVDKTVREMGGVARIESNPGEGTKFILTVPISTAVAELLHVDVGGHMVSIPMRRIIETQRVAEDQLSSPGGAKRFRWRNELIPYVDLKPYLPDMDSQQEDDEAISDYLQEEQKDYVVVLEQSSGAISLPVDGFQGKSQAVLHPLGDQLLESGPYSGATVMGNGYVSLILDPDRLNEYLRENQGYV